MAAKIRKCTVKGCDKKQLAKGICTMPYMRKKRHGNVNTVNSSGGGGGGGRKFKPNKTHILKDYAEIELYNQKGDIADYGIIDIDEVNKISKYRWSLNAKGYIFSCIKNRNVFLHRMIINVTDSKKQVDHINRNILDNRKCNLRICTNSQNQMNSKKRSGTKNMYKGASWSGYKEAWHASICKNKTHYSLGYFPTEREAAEAYNTAAIKYFGEFALLNKFED